VRGWAFLGIQWWKINISELKFGHEKKFFINTVSKLGKEFKEGKRLNFWTNRHVDLRIHSCQSPNRLKNTGPFGEAK
jgi:hypothetical protein